MKIQFTLIGLLFITISSIGQEIKADFKPSGNPFFDVHWNYHADLTEDATQNSEFELKRAYLGYAYKFSKNIFVKINVDVGSNDGGSDYTAYLKAAQLDWKVSSGVKLSMGLIGMKQFKVQEKFWGYRYIFKSFQDQNGFGSSADLGINAEFKLTSNLLANFTISNGEGYKKVQDADGNQKVGASMVFTPVDGLTTKIYADSQPSEDSEAISTFSLFAGYKLSDWRLGAEFNKMNNGKKYSSPAQDHELDGFSFYSTYIISKKVEIFARFDQLGSNNLAGETEAWNISKDGNQIIAGLQVAPIKGLKFALNYQNFSYDDTSKNSKSLIYINAQFKI